MNSTLELEQPMSEQLSLPNKYFYPEFAGFTGEKGMRRIAKAILPRALYITWETIEEEHAYDKECFLSLEKVAREIGRTQRTIQRNIKALMRRGLLVLRATYKLFHRPDGSTYKKAVVVKDFSGLYALAHEYDEWQQSENYVEASWEYLELIRQDPHLLAKLCRFENYRRLLDRQYDPFQNLELDPRFALYQEEIPSNNTEKRAEDASMDLSGRVATKMMSKCVSKVSEERINEIASINSLERDSFDSETTTKGMDEASAPLSSENELEAWDYTNQVEKDKTSAQIQYESQTKPVPPTQKTVPPAACKRRESEEMRSDVQQAKRAMAVAGLTPDRAERPQTEELPAPAKHPLARSFVQRIASPFGDLNEKGSKTGIERSIETFGLRPAEVLLCLVRAYIVARNTKEGKVRSRRPETGMANRMPLFCAMFRKFAQALGSGSNWEYTWEQMLEDIAADDRLGLWIIEHQAELQEWSKQDTQGEALDRSTPAEPESAMEMPVEREDPSPLRSGPETATAPKMIATDDPRAGWSSREAANDRAEYLRNEVDFYSSTYTWEVLPTPYGRWGFAFLRRLGRVTVMECLNRTDIQVCNTLCSQSQR